MDIILMMGPPGSGKGTYSGKLAEKYGYVHISVGDLLRARGQIDDEIGREVKALMDRNVILPDRLVTDLVAERLASEPAGATIILDGYPRSVGQARLIDEVIDEKGYNLKAVITLECDEAILIERILARARNEIDRDRGKILKRMEDYNKITEPVAAHYEAQGLLEAIPSGEGSIDECVRLVEEALGLMDTGAPVPQLCLEWERYAPMAMPNETKREIFNEIAAIIMSREGREYDEAWDALHPESKESAEEAAALTKEYVENIAFNAIPAITIHIARYFNRQAAEPAAIREAYAAIRERSENHYEAQLKTGDDLSAQDKMHNAHVRLYQAVYNAYVDRILARIPQ